MNNVFLIPSLLIILCLGSCSESKEELMDNGEQDASEILQISESEVKITLQDYLEEASSIKSEAQEIITRAEEINCSDAKKSAEKVLLISKKAEEHSNLLRVEHFIEEASQALADAEDAIIYCEEKNEISYASDLKDDQ